MKSKFSPSDFRPCVHDARGRNIQRRSWSDACRGGRLRPRCRGGSRQCLALVAGGRLAPAGVLRAGVFTEIWTGEMIKAFRTTPEALGWMQRIRSYNQYVNQDVIHFVAIGGDPNVLVNSITYPLAITALTDADKPISLDKFSTEATPVTKDEVHASSYDKMASVLERHRDALREKIAQRGIHAIAPDENANGHPVIKTTGASDGRVTQENDLCRPAEPQRQFDKMGIPGKDRVLVFAPTM